MDLKYSPVDTPKVHSPAWKLQVCHNTDVSSDGFDGIMDNENGLDDCHACVCASDCAWRLNYIGRYYIYQSSSTVMSNSST